MDFALFLVVNAVLLLRPEELFPALAGVRIYLFTMALCVVAAAPRLAETLRPSELAGRPVTCCVLGLWAAGIVSLVGVGLPGDAQWVAGEFGKSILYYLLLVSIVDTPERLRLFLGAVVVFALGLTVPPLLQHLGLIDLPVFQKVPRWDQLDPETGEPILQLISTGIYADPNDFCLILVTGVLCALYRVATAGDVVGRVAWALPIGAFGWAISLTKSRGGLLGLGVAAGVWAVGRFGWRRTLLPGVLLAAAAMAAGGRQTNFNLGEGDTARQRIELWDDGFLVMRENPLTGVGYARFWRRVGLEAHSSFVAAYVETGLLGGSLFFGMFALLAVGLGVSRPADPVLARMRPFVQAVVVGYAVGILSVSRAYIVPTYMAVGLGAAFLRLAPVPAARHPRVGVAGVVKLYALGAAGLAAFFVATKILLKLGNPG